MNDEIYLKAKNDFLSQKKPSITAIAKLHNINRKKLSEKLKKDGLYSGKGYSDEITKKGLKMLEEGKSISSICKKLNIDRYAFTNHLDKIGARKIKRDSSYNQYPTNSKLAKDIINDYKSGVTRKNLMQKYNISDHTIYKILDANNIARDKNHIRIHDIKEDIFDIIDIPEKAYWLGFLYADGYVSKNLSVLELSLQEKDATHVEKFKEFIGSSSPVKNKIITLNNKEFTAKRLLICNKRICSDLNKHGCTPAKSLTIGFPNLNTLPESLQSHFIRGFIDGDGTILKANGALRITLLGPEKFLRAISKIISDNCNLNERTISNRKNNGKTFSMSWNGNKQCLKIYKYLFNNSTICLNRKWNKFNAALGDSTVSLDLLE